MQQIVAEIACEVAMRLMLEHGVHFQRVADPDHAQLRARQPALAGEQLLGFAQVAWDAVQRTRTQPSPLKHPHSARTEREALEARLFHHLESLPELDEGQCRQLTELLVEETLRRAGNAPPDSA